jgi:hypothetical protein
MRGEHLGMGDGRHGRGRINPPERQISTGGRGEHFRHQRTLSEEPMRIVPEETRKKNRKK